MTSSQKRMLSRIAFGGALFVVALILGGRVPIPARYQTVWRLGLFLVPYFIIGYDILWKAMRNIVRGQLLDENFLMCIASIGAFALQEYPEAVAVILFYQVGELFQNYAVNRSRKSISDLMDIRPDYANMESGGQLKQVDPEEVGIGDIIVVKPGEKIPLDGVIIDGASMVDTSALTGESVPRSVDIGHEVISGCINKSGLLRIRVAKLFEESTVSKILEMVENASEKKAHTENFITRFARYYTPAVVACALVMGIVPPLLFAGSWAEWVERALIFLMVSCPCALVISVPMSFFGGIGGASKCGILIKGSNYLEALASTEIVVFDKTGTLTKGTFKVTAVHPDEISEDHLLETAALSESYSDHPISTSLKEAYGKAIDGKRISHTIEVAGHGVVATVDGRAVHTGNGKLMAQAGVRHKECSLPGTIVHVAIDEAYAGHVVISDEIKPDSARAVRALKEEGVRKTVMLTGDTNAVGEPVAKALGIDEVYTDLLPGDKVERVEELLKEKSKTGKLAFVGDGINDAPVLSRADIGIAMGALGSDAAIEAADIVLMDDQPIKIATAMQIARKTLRIVRQNIVFALALKLIVLLLGAFGQANMWEAMFVDVGVSVIAVLNASRALSVKNLPKAPVRVSPYRPERQI